jgi:hypothetical protein
MWSACSLALLAKIPLNTRIVHYGFYLATPGTTITIVTVLFLVPAALAMREPAGAAQPFQYLKDCVLIGAIVRYLALSHEWCRTKVVTIGSGRPVSGDHAWRACAEGAAATGANDTAQHAVGGAARRYDHE